MKYLLLTSLKIFMFELILIILMLYLMEVIHVELIILDNDSNNNSTCLTNEAKFPCLKYFGSISSANSFVFFTIKAFPSLFQEIKWLYSGFY